MCEDERRSFLRDESLDGLRIFLTPLDPKVPKKTKEEKAADMKKLLDDVLGEEKPNEGSR